MILGIRLHTPGSNFIFHDSQGFESGSTEELEIAWKFIEKKSAETELKNQLHAIWYCYNCSSFLRLPFDIPYMPVFFFYDVFNLL